MRKIDPKLALEVERLDIRSVLLTNHHMKDFAGSELVTYDLALFFKNLGVEVTIATFVVGNSISKLCEQQRIDIIDLTKQASKLVAKKFDRVWGHHWPTWGYCINELLIKYKYLICSSLSPFLPVEAIPSTADVADKILFNSLENLRQSSYSNEPNSIVFPNSLGNDWFTPVLNKNDTETKILVISNHIPKEIYGIEEYLNKHNIKIQFIGHLHEPSLVIPDIFNNVIATITIGHSVQKSISRGFKTYCYDHFGGAGWIIQSNFDLALEYNFSGRCCSRKLDSSDIAKEILNEISTPSINTNNLLERANTLFSLDKNILQLLIKPPPL